jgi:DNA polymerase I-like protein with 3'-5' exonuclease and polymerase domains
LFKELGFNLEAKDKATGLMKDSIDAKVIEPQKNISDIAPIYLEYKAAAKVVGTYGQNFLDQVNPVSGRIHTSYNQLGADTTRITSGGKDKNNKLEYVNLLNLPSDEETRACFVAEKGNKWISIDYSGQETYLMASIANDEAIIKELTEGSGDIHSLTAYMAYPEIPRDTPIKEIKKKFHNLRQEAKGIEFAINYGGDANTIHQNKGIPLEEAQKVYNNYMSGFYGLKKYQEFRRKDWFEKGYILLNPLTGHKAFIYDYDELLSEKRRMSEDGFWDYYREMKVSARTCDTVQMVKHFFKRKAASEKQSINYPIQATGSQCLRKSMIYLWKYIISHNLQGIVKICVAPYDELNLEAPADIAEEIAKVTYDCMVRAGAIFCTRCKLDADISRNKDGSLPDHWIH